MTSFIGAFALVYLLSVSFTNEVSTNVSAVEKLVDYNYSLNFTNVIPGMKYNSTIAARWAVPDSALSNLEGRSISVKVTASTGENSSLYFLSDLGTESKEASATLRCDVSNSTCANTSVLSAGIPVFFTASPNETGEYSISLKSEIVDEGSATLPGADFFGSLERIFQGNGSATPETSSNGNNSSGENFLDSLKPESNTHDPVEFLRENTLISVAALIIVILITGAYLLNTKD
jgi:hypothetical protein